MQKELTITENSGLLNITKGETTVIIDLNQGTPGINRRNVELVGATTASLTINDRSFHFAQGSFHVLIALKEGEAQQILDAIRG